jgi:phage/plasmid-associated DNA primase
VNDQGFLRWLVEGAVAWYRKIDLNAPRPASVTRAIDEYLQSQDQMAHFIDAECEQGQGLCVLTEVFLMAYNKTVASDQICLSGLFK